MDLPKRLQRSNRGKSDARSKKYPSYIIHDFQWKFTTLRLQRGNWVPGIIAKDVRNFCRSILSPLEPWYPITRLMKRHHCPFPNGVSCCLEKGTIDILIGFCFFRLQHIEEFNMVNIGSLDMLFPTSFVGEWKLYMDATTVRDGKLIKECMMLPFRFEEF